MPDPARLTLERTRDALRAALAEVEVALAASADGAPALPMRLVEAVEPTVDLVPLKEAAHAMRIEEEAARKRAQRGAGEMIDGRWHFTRTYVDSVRASKMSR